MSGGHSHSHAHDHVPSHGHHAHDHDDHHGHDHHHGLGHSHAPTSFGRAFAIGVLLNVAIVVLQGAYGYWANSVALIADAGHNLSDVLGLLVAWAGAVLARQPPSRRFTYGFKRSSILAALFNAVFLLVAIGALSWEAARRLLAPEPVAGTTVMAVAAIALVLNGLTAWLFASGRHGDINIRGAFLHMAADAAVSAGVIVAGLVIMLTGWVWLDPVASLSINAVIVWSTWSLLRDSVTMSLDAVPPGIEAGQVRGHLAELPGVVAVHDLHIWAMSTTETALTAHLVMPSGHPDDGFLVSTAEDLRKRFRIGHVTLQIELGEGDRCPLACDTAA